MRRRPARQDSGSTLVEVLVAMLVFGTFATMLSTTVLQTTKLTRESGTRELSAQRVSTLMQQVTRDLRTAVRVGPAADATAFAEASQFKVVFYSSVTPDILLETLCAQSAGAAPAVSCGLPPTSTAGVFRTTRPPDPASVYPELTYTTTSTTTRRIENDHVLLVGGFRYDVRKRDPATGSLVTTSGLTSVPAADLKHIVAVHVQFQLDGDGAGRGRPVVLESTVRPFNP